MAVLETGTMARILLLVPVLFLALAPRPAAAQDEYKAAVAALDRLDPAVGYALSVRQEGNILLGAGGGVFGLTLITGIIDIAQGGDVWSNYTFAVGVPAGLGLVVAGLPAMLSSRKFLDFYIEADAPPSELARLKLIRRWRMDLLQMKRDTGLLGAAFLGAAGLVSGIVWGARDARGVHGTPGSGFANYDSSGGLLTMMFVAAAGSGALTSLLAHIELDQERRSPHRVYEAVQVGLAPVVAPRPDGELAVGVQGLLSVRF